MDSLKDTIRSLQERLLAQAAAMPNPPATLSTAGRRSNAVPANSPVGLARASAARSRQVSESGSAARDSGDAASLGMEALKAHEALVDQKLKAMRWEMARQTTCCPSYPFRSWNNGYLHPLNDLGPTWTICHNSACALTSWRGS